MTLTFRPEMKAIVHEVDGEPVTVIGKTIDGASTAMVAMVESADGADRLRPGARVRCSYVDHSGVHEFSSTVISADALALNHRLVRLTVAAPTAAERLQRREHVRVNLELAVLLETDDGETHTAQSIDLSAGGMAVLWTDPGIEPPEPGTMITVRFRSERFDHFHQAISLGTYPKGKQQVMRLRFEGITRSGQDRLATVVFAAQRAERQRLRDAGLA